MNAAACGVCALKINQFVRERIKKVVKVFAEHKHIPCKFADEWVIKHPVN